MRKAILIIVVVITVLGGAILWGRSDILFELQLSKKDRLTIREKEVADEDKMMLYLTYHNPPTIGMVGYTEQVVNRPDEPISFESIVDSKSGLICVFDNSNVGFLLLYDPTTDDLWDSAGGGRGLDRTPEKWQLILSELSARYPAIPYGILPQA